MTMKLARSAMVTDAVVVVPGVMGSELVDEDDQVIWGLRPGLAARAWWHGHLAELHVTQEDLAGGRRLRASRLLRRVGFLPLLGGTEPYTDLLDQLKRAVVDERAVVEFPYDW